MRDSNPRWPGRVALLSLVMGAFCLFAGSSLAEAGSLGGTVWNLTGTGTTQAGSFSNMKPFTATLTFNPDRTYTLRFTSALFPDNDGVWFENAGRVVLYQQNLLAELRATELMLWGALGTPVELELLKYEESATPAKTLGSLTFRATYQFNASVPSQGFLIGVTVRLKATGTPGS